MIFRGPFRWLFLVLLAAAFPANAAPRDRVEAEIARIAAITSGTVGVSAWRIGETGEKIELNPDIAFPMASTFKVAVAGRILERVDRGELTLDRLIEVPANMHVASEVIADRFIHPGLSISVHNLLELMMTQSDNTATDVLTELAGGPAAVTAWVRGQGVEGLRVDRDTAGVLRGFFALPEGPFPEALEAGLIADPSLLDRSLVPNPSFDSDPRDTASPRAMALLLDRIFSGEALSAASTEALAAMMVRNRTGNARIRARLPIGVEVADKTGTVGGSTNDVGVVTLPGESGHRVVMAIFVKQSDAPMASRERTIADIARAIYDFYAFTAVP
ncbi:class A beta-lactamase [Qipengyuania sp. MTN3-11]|uniref:class A beta-lactamase n=1 Tax=Qipengyuania sp. MTN3-11 TaxID=3056557 RepID=UPI0036F34905